MAPLVSIIVPVYGAEAYLAKCIDSILAQTLRDFELILIDDGSPDKCGEICDRYAAEDSRIRVLHTSNKGVAAARNVGLREVTGRFVGFVDSDDWIEPDMYDVLFRQIERDASNIAICSIWYGPEGRQVAPHRSRLIQVIDGYQFAQMISDDVVITNHLCNKLFRQEVLAGCSFPDGRHFEDVSFFTTLLPRISKVSYVEVPKYHYVQRRDGICGANKPASRWDRYESCRERRAWVRSRYPELDVYAAASLIRPGFSLYDGFALGLGVPDTQAGQVVMDFKDVWPKIRNTALLPVTLRMKARFMMKQPSVYGMIRRLFNFCWPA
jgi:glycosyltransferase involved in cell wall biosynthesis